MNKTFKNDNEIVNSIVGFSEGAQAAFVTAANFPGLYKTIVCSNGTLYRVKEGLNLIDYFANGDYHGLQNMEIIFFASQNNNNWNPYISQSLIDLIEHGVPKENIHLYTNDYVLVNGPEFFRYGEIPYEPVKDILGDESIYFLSNSEALMYGEWTRHGDGIKMLFDSNILSYLSSDEHRIKCDEQNKNHVISLK